MSLRLPRVDPAALGRPGTAAFVAILALDSLSRATVSAIVPLQAYDLLGSAQKVSVLYFLTAVTGLHVTYVDGMPIGMFRSRVQRVEGIGPEDGVEPSIVFARGADGRLTLIAALLPDRKGMQLYDLREPQRREATIARVMRGAAGEIIRVAAVGARSSRGS